MLSFSLVGLWTIRLLVQVHRHWVQFTLARKGYDNHNCHNKPQIGKGLECEWCYAWKRWSWEFEDFEKESVWSWLWARQETILSLPLWHRELSSLPWSRELESWLWAMWTDSWVVCNWGRRLRSWVKTMVLRSWGPTRQLGVLLA